MTRSQNAAPLPLGEVRKAVTDARGIQSLCDGQIPESDHLEYKLTLDNRDPGFQDELRADCASLASSGEGYLLVGVDESRDGRSAAVKAPGLPTERAQP